MSRLTGLRSKKGAYEPQQLAEALRPQIVNHELSGERIR